MRFLPCLGLCLFLLTAVSCSNDSAPGSVEEEGVTLPDFRLIGEDAESTFQYSYTGEAGEGVEVNLRQTLGLDPQYLTLRQVGEVLSFYSFSEDNFSNIQLNTLTGQSVAYPDFYTVTDERSITWGANSEGLLFLGYYSPKGSRDFGLRILDPSDGSFTDVPIALGIQQAYDPLYFRERLLVTYRDANGAYKVAIFNTESREIILTLDFGPGIPNVLIDDLGNIGIIIGSGGSNFVYQEIDAETLDQISETTFVLDKFLPPGPHRGSIYGTTLYYTNFLAQPAPVLYGPAYFDLGTGENFELDILSIVQEVEDDTGLTIDLTALQYYEEPGIFLMGYAIAGSGVELKGGVLAISKSGLLLERIELPFVPTYFVKP